MQIFGCNNKLLLFCSSTTIITFTSPQQPQAAGFFKTEQDILRYNSELYITIITTLNILNLIKLN